MISASATFGSREKKKKTKRLFQKEKENNHKIHQKLAHKTTCNPQLNQAFSKIAQGKLVEEKKTQTDKKMAAQAIFEVLIFEFSLTFA